MTLPDNLPGIAKAKLPETYEHARNALDKCSRIDECAEWANKAEALASYAKQAHDDALRKMADRIQARAIRRCGELLRAIKAGTGGRPEREKPVGAPPQVSRSQAARDAGLSRDQKVAALRVARIPESDFEAAVESDDPPTVTRMLEERKARPLIDLKGRDPEEFARSTEGQGHLRRLAEFAEQIAPDVVARGSFPREHKAIRQHIDTVMPWLMALMGHLEKP